jgi:hypothetical protein
MQKGKSTSKHLKTLCRPQSLWTKDPVFFPKTPTYSNQRSLQTLFLVSNAISQTWAKV